MSVPSVQHIIDKTFRNAISHAFGIEADALIAPSANAQNGDYQSNAAMSLAKLLGSRGEKTNPRQVAEKLKEAVLAQVHGSDSAGMIAALEVAGPGFINIRLNRSWMSQHLNQLLQANALGIEPAEKPMRVVVDYSGPNVAKEMHIGHIRSTILGDAVCNVLEAMGHTVIRQNHLGDWGTQFGMLITHLSDQVQSQNQSSVDIADLEEFYRAAKARFDAEPAFAERSRLQVVALQGGDAKAKELWQMICEQTRKHYEPLYERMNVKLRRQHERGESSYNAMLAGVVEELAKLGLAVASDGAMACFPDGPETTPLIIRKSDGGYGYGTTDLAAVKYRCGAQPEGLGAQRVMIFTDARQQQHFSQVFKVAKSAGWNRGASLEHAPFGSMLGADGKPFKTRTGGTVKLADLLDEAEERALAVVREKNPELPDQQLKAIAQAVGIGAVKYADMSKDRISDYVFKWELMLSFEGNTAPYLQYAHARICSIFRKAGTDAALGKIVLDDPTEVALGLHLLKYPEVLHGVARDLKPHLLCTWLYELAGYFSSFYEKCDVLKADGALKGQRLALSDLVRRHLAHGLDLLGIAHPEQM